MADLDKLLKWARLDQREARLDAAEQLRKHAGDPAAQAALLALLDDPDAAVASQAFASLGNTCTPEICVAGLASPHRAVSDSSRQQLARMALGFDQLTELGVAGADAVGLVSNQGLISAILDAKPWRDLAADELPGRGVPEETIAKLRGLEAALRGAGRDTTWLTAHLASKREGAMRNRRAPRAKPKTSENLRGFFRDFEAENFDGMDDYVHMLTPGDWVALHRELAGMMDDPEGQAALVDAIGHGPPRGLFILLEHLAGPHADVVQAAAEAIAHMCEIFPNDIALTPDELAIVMGRVPDLVEPFSIGVG